VLPLLEEVNHVNLAGMAEAQPFNFWSWLKGIQVASCSINVGVDQRWLAVVCHHYHFYLVCSTIPEGGTVPLIFFSKTYRRFFCRLLMMTGRLGWPKYQSLAFCILTRTPGLNTSAGLNDCIYLPCLIYLPTKWIRIDRCKAQTRGSFCHGFVVVKTVAEC
jgi:hypothetical protein